MGAAHKFCAGIDGIIERAKTQRFFEHFGALHPLNHPTTHVCARACTQHKGTHAALSTHTPPPHTPAWRVHERAQADASAHAHMERCRQMPCGAGVYIAEIYSMACMYRVKLQNKFVPVASSVKVEMRPHMRANMRKHMHTPAAASPVSDACQRRA